MDKFRSEFVTIDYDPTTKPLPLYSMDYKFPHNFDEKVIYLQNKYLELRKTRKGPPLSFREKLIQLKVMAQSLVKFTNTNNDYKFLEWGAVGLLELAMIFHDKLIIEAYCSQKNSHIFIHHSNYGKCKSNFIFHSELWNSIRIQSEIEANRRITKINPSLKTSFETDLGTLRISLQIPPLTESSPAFVIRRLPRTPINIKSLVEQNQISLSHSLFLQKAIADRKNIVIAGEPSSGKTTLANALLLTCKPEWRIIILEDVKEVNIPEDSLPLSIRYSLPVTGDNKKYQSREIEIAKLLHRSPDYVFLGELQTAIDTKTAFEGFSAGIRGMATTHARNYSSLLSRWVNSHKLSVELIDSIDVVVITEREFTANGFRMFVDIIHENISGNWKELPRL